MRERRLQVTRSARWVTLGEPGPDTREVWVALHGYRQLAGRFLRRFASLDDGSRWLVAPEALSRFYVEDVVRRHGADSRVGASWMTREDREAEIADYVAYLDALAAHAGATAPVILGFSQGSETASRWAVLGAVDFRALVFWGGGPAEDLDMDAAARRLDGRRVVFVVGDEDGWARKKRAGWEGRLADLGARVAVVSYPGGHRVEPAAFPALVEILSD